MSTPNERADAADFGTDFSDPRTWSDVDSMSALDMDDVAYLTREQQVEAERARARANGEMEPDIEIAGAREDGGGPHLATILAASGTRLRVPPASEQARSPAPYPEAGDPEWPPAADAYGVNLGVGGLRDRAIAHAADPYSTKLSPGDEAQFQQWSHVAGLEPSPKYDLRGYWLDLSHGNIPPPPHGREHALPPTWVTPRDLDNFSINSVYHPRYERPGDVIDQRYPTSELDMQGNWVPPIDTDDIAATERVGHRRRSDARLNALEQTATDTATWPTPDGLVVPGRSNVVRPPVRQRSHSSPRGR